MENKLINLEHIHKSYKSKVLTDINFECIGSQIICIAGANGCGKSTLLSILSGILKPNSGQVNINCKISFVTQENGLFEDMTVKDNIDFWACAFKKKSTYDLFETAELRKKVKFLSGGMKKRLSIYISLLNDPDCLILDEPTTSLDLIYQKYVIDTIIDFKAQGKAVIFTSHNPLEIMISDQLYILRGGKFVYNGRTNEFSDSNSFQYKLQNIISKE